MRKGRLPSTQRATGRWIFEAIEDHGHTVFSINTDQNQILAMMNETDAEVLAQFILTTLERKRA